MVMKKGWSSVRVRIGHVAKTRAALALALLAGALALPATAAVRLKPLADGETRETMDGASWATAYSDASAAISAAMKADDKTLYAAAGVYRFSAGITLSDSLTIYGGFKGASDEETVDGRDAEANETIFTGDYGADDVWSHYVLDTNANKVTVTTLADNPTIVDGRFSPPPAYDDDFDIYLPDVKKNNVETMFTLAKDKEYLFDGMVFMGFTKALVDGNSQKTLAFRGCRVLAYRVNRQDGAVSMGGGTLELRDTRFAYALSAGNGSAGVYVQGAVSAKDCSFESIYANGEHRATVFFHADSSVNNATNVLENVSFVRNGRVPDSGVGGMNYGGPGVAFSGESAQNPKLLRNVVVSNCYSVLTKSYSGFIPIVTTKQGVWMFEGCRFSNNLCAARGVSGNIYAMFGCWQASGKSLYDGCVFDGNVARVYAVDEAEGSLGVGICGAPAADSAAAYVNCVFDRNSAEAGESLAGWEVTRSQGVLHGARSGDAWTAVANCTFRSKGDEGVADVAVFGVSLTKPANVVNCLFMSDADVAQPFAAPSGLTSANGICAWNATAQNVTDVPSCVAYDGGGWQSDAVPFAEAKSGGALTPAARTPGIRATGDVAVGTINRSAIDVRYRPAGSETWTSLLAGSPNLSEVKTWKTIGDFADPATPRTEGQFTRGAVQALSDAAESGRTLTLRRSPLAGGTLTGPSAQAVADGSAAQSVTAEPAENATFAGWFTVSGVEYSADKTLSVSSLTEDLVLVAKFSTPKVSVTFDLGEAGTFTDGDSSKVTVELDAGTALAVPEYTASEGWFVEGFSPAVPETAPMTNASYAATYVTTAVRVFRVVPAGDVPETSDGTGSSWENAASIDDVNAVIKDAARVRGEIWLKKGVYDVKSAINLRPNVSVYGGFAGTETERGQADPDSNKTVLTGDVKRDDYWKVRTSRWVTADIDGSPKVYDYDSLAVNSHDPNEDGLVWHAYNTGDNTKTCFSTDTAVTVTNCVLSGMTLVSFGNYAVSIGGLSTAASLAIEDCSFYGNGFVDGAYAPVMSNGRVAISRCRFVGNVSSVYLLGSGAASTVADSLVESCIGTDWISAVYLSSTQPPLFTNCTFRANGLWGCFVLHSRCASVFADCLFESNRTSTATRQESGGKYYSGLFYHESYAPTFRRCRFVGNMSAGDAGNLSGGKAMFASMFMLNNDAAFRDSLFSGNRVEVTNSNATETARCASVALVRGGCPLFLNCTMTGNAATVTGACDVASTLVTGTQSSTRLALVHCTLADNEFNGGGTAAEVYQDKIVDNGWALAVLNSVLYSTNASYRPIVQTGTLSPLMVASSHLSNAAEDGADYDLTRANALWRDVTSADPKLAKNLERDSSGLRAWGVKKTSPVAKNGLKTYLVGTTVWFYDAVTKPSNPWRQAQNAGEYKNSVSGLSADTSPVVADAFGRERDASLIAAGPLLPTGPVGTIIILR